MFFEEAYQRIRFGDMPLYSLVTKDRCKEIWNTVEELKNLDGDCIEVGVWRGGTAALIAQQIKNLNLNSELFLCDTFTGVVKADKNDKYYKNGEHSDCSITTVNELFTLYFKLPKPSILKGIFPEETGNIVKDKKFKFIHLDVDVYQSTKDAFYFLFDRLVIGGKIIIDDYKWPHCTGIEKFVKEIENDSDKKVYQGKANYHVIIEKIK